MRKLLPLFLIFIFLIGAVHPARAQQAALSTANLYAVDYANFPAVTALMDVFDSQGIFASGLSPQSVTVIEDGQPLPADSLTELAIPLQLTIAVNQGLSLDARDSTGLSRFQRAAQVLMQWAQSRPADLPDDYSLVSQAGVVVSHTNAQGLVSSLNSYQPDFRASVPNLLSLSIAMDTVLVQTPRLGMKRAILFITPHMDDANIAAAMAPLMERARQNNIHVYVWMIDIDTTFATTSAAVFNSLAIETGGSMFQFSGAERFPDPEVYFSPLRRVYALAYTSRLRNAGEHKAAIQVNIPSGQLISNEQSFTLDIQPPNPFPINPPLQITRRAPADDPYNTEILLPASQEITIIVEFPDQHPRPLTRTTLYVDGQIADENTAEPFDVFTWDLSSYSSSMEHQLMVEAVDTLGLSKQSMPVPITVTVIKPPGGLAGFLARYRGILTVGAIIFAGLALFMILLGGRIRFSSLKAAQQQRRAQADPLTQPIPMIAEAPAVAVIKEKKPRAKRMPKGTAGGSKSKKEAGAALMRVNAEGQPLPVSPIPLLENEITFGADPVQCNQILDDASISPLHARLRISEDGVYMLQDANSTAGTWVNYDPVSREGLRLTHGDMVHFGQLAYRFVLSKPPETPKPRVVLQPEE